MNDLENFYIEEDKKFLRDELEAEKAAKEILEKELITANDKLVIADMQVIELKLKCERLEKQNAALMKVYETLFRLLATKEWISTSYCDEMVDVLDALRVAQKVIGE